MKTLLYFSILVSLSGCAGLNGFKYNQHMWYHQSLSEVEKDNIKDQGYIIREWHGTNNLGDYTRGKILIRKLDKANKFDFVEIGSWEERHSASAAKGWKGTLKDSIIYDEFGNISSRKLYLSEGKIPASEGLIFEEWKSTNTDSLRQEIINYHENGQISSKQYVTVKYPKNYSSDYAKEKYLTKLEVFDEKGNKLPTSSYQRYGWYLPKTIMKKK